MINTINEAAVDNSTAENAAIGELVVIPQLSAHRSAGGQLVLTEKFLTGMQGYAQRWPGKVTALVNVSSHPSNNLDHRDVTSGDWAFDVEPAPLESQEQKERLRRAALVLGGVAGISPVPQVLVMINNFRTICQIIKTEAPDWQRWGKRTIRAGIHEVRLRRAMGRLAGLQCNGTPTYESYKHLNSNTMLFFDSRMGADDLIEVKSLELRLQDAIAGQPLRLLFSGRLLSIKGVQDLPDVALELRRLNVPFEMHICGDGPCTPILRQKIKTLELEGCVFLRGTLSYRSQLLPLAREATDLFVCPHWQGDPSHTYLETMGCGVPIVGYANQAWAGMAPLSGAGWVTPLKQPRLLAAKIAELDRDREQLLIAARAARAFASRNLFEATMDRRVAHLLACVRNASGCT